MLQHFYHKEFSEMLSFLHLWGYSWKCEFDYRRQNRIENYYHHDGEQLLFKKNLHQNTQSKKKDVLVIILLQETKNSNLYNKNYTNVK